MIVIVVAVALVLTGILLPFAPIVLIVAVVLVLIPILSFLREYADWRSEEYLVTTMRVIQAEGVINKHVIDSSLEKVNDVVLTQSFLGRMLDYGDIEILTASEIGVNKLEKIARPVKFKTEMLNQKEALGLDDRSPRRPAAASDIPSMISELDELRKQGVLSEEEFQQKKAQLLSKM